MTDKQITLVNASVTDDEDDDKPAPYQKRTTDIKLIDTVLMQVEERLQREKNIRPAVRRDIVTIQEGVQQIGKAGEAFHDLPTESQTGLLVNMLHSHNLAQMAETFMVGLELKPAQPSGPIGPQFGFVPMGPGGGMGGGMGGVRPPQPTPPGGFPPFDPQHQQYPYPPQQGEYQASQHGNAYAQPHAYPSYPHPQQGGYPPHPGYPPGGYPGQPPGYPPYPPQAPQSYPPYPYPPQGAPGTPQHPYPPQQEQQPPQDAGAQAPTWPPQPEPVIIDAETEDVKKDDDKL